MRLSAGHILVILLLIQLAPHILTLNRVFINDEGTHLTSGWLLYLGRTVYGDFALLQYLPGAAFIASLSYSLLGPELWAAKLFLAWAMMLTTLLVFRTARKLYGEPEAISAAAAFVLFAPLFGGLQFLPEPFMALFAILLFNSLYSYEKGGGSRWLFASGVLCAILAILKIPGLLLLPASLVFLWARAFLRKETARLPAEVGVLLVGFLLPLLALFAWLYSLGVLEEAYVQVIFQILFRTQESMFSNPVKLAPYLFIMLLPVIFLKRVKEDIGKGHLESLLLLLLALASLYAVLVRFQPNRVFYAIPLLSMMAGFLFQRYLDKRQRAYIWAFILATMLMLPVFLFFQTTASSSTRESVLSHTSPEDRILVIPYGHILYFQLKREPGYRYLGLGPWGQPDDTEQNAIADLEARKPALILYNKRPQWGKNFSEYEPLIDEYIWDHYEVAGENWEVLFLVRKGSPPGPT